MQNFLQDKHVITEIILATYVLPVKDGGAHKNRPSHGLAINLSGEKTYSFNDGKSYTVAVNEMIYLPKFSNYTVQSTTLGDMYCINFQRADEKTFSPFVFSPANANEILKAFQTAEKAWTRNTAGREYQVLSSLYKILSEMQRGQSVPYLPKTKQNIIQPAVHYIHKNYTTSLIDMQFLSGLCGISYDYLRQLFKKIYGVSPIKYINALKLKHAQELLASGLYSVQEAAYNAGFSDVSHFSRFFKDHTGVSPSKYLQVIR